MRLYRLRIGKHHHVLMLLAMSSIFWQGLIAAPYWGMVTKIHQPGGVEVDARIFGDEFYARYESFEGYTLVRDPVSGWYSYGMKSSKDPGELISSGIPYETMTPDNNLLESLERLGIQKHLLEGGSKIKTKIETMRSRHMYTSGRIRNMDDIRAMNVSNARENGVLDNSKLTVNRTGSVVGLLVLVDFSDDPATIARADVDSFANQATGYNRNTNNGSVRNYYNDVSNGLLDFKNYVTAYYRASHPKTYYTDTTVGWCVRAGELLREALDDLENNQNFDFSELSYEPVSRKILAVSLFYAGGCPNNWCQGLWPGSTGLGPSFTADGVIIDHFQFTDMGNILTLQTFCHECGHMVMDFPDLYEYSIPDSAVLSSTVGGFCLMCNGMSATNPVPPCAPFRILAGWETVTDLSNAATNTNYTITANNNTSFIYPNLSTSNERPEWFCIENRAIIGRNANLPGSGMLIWHVEEQSGSNTQRGNNAGSCAAHFLVSLEQADGARHLDTIDGITGDAHDLFPNGGFATTFNDATTPNANWFCPTPAGNNSSHMSISNISNPGNTMTFTYSNELTVAAVQHVATINQDPFNQQTITITTGVNGQQVHVWGTNQFVGATTKTTSSGQASFTILAAHPGRITVDVYGGGQRYRGQITIVSASWPGSGLVFSKSGVRCMELDLSGNIFLRKRVVDNNTLLISSGLTFLRPPMSAPNSIDGGALFTNQIISQRQTGLTPVTNDLLFHCNSSLLSTMGASQLIKISGSIWEEIQ